MFKKRAKRDKASTVRKADDGESDSDTEAAVKTERKAPVPKNPANKYTLEELQEAFNLPRTDSLDLPLSSTLNIQTPNMQNGREEHQIGEVYNPKSHDLSPEEVLQPVREITIDDIESEEDLDLNSDWEDYQLSKSGIHLQRKPGTVVLPTLTEISARLDRHMDQLRVRRDEIKLQLASIETTSN